MKSLGMPRVWVQIIDAKRMGKAKRQGFNVSHKRTRTHKHEYVHIEEHLALIAELNRAKNLLEAAVSAGENLRCGRDELADLLLNLQEKSNNQEKQIDNLVNDLNSARKVASSDRLKLLATEAKMDDVARSMVSLSQQGFFHPIRSALKRLVLELRIFRDLNG